MALSNADQEKYVFQGLALGVLAAGREAIPGAKFEFEMSFEGAWHDWPHRGKFPRIARPTGADPLYQLTHGTENRRGPLLAAWDNQGAWIYPYVWQDGWSVEESGEMLAGWSGVPWPAWQELASEFLRRLDRKG